MQLLVPLYDNSKRNNEEEFALFLIVLEIFNLVICFLKHLLASCIRIF